MFDAHGIRNENELIELGVAKINDKVKITKRDKLFVFNDGEKEIAKVSDTVSLNLNPEISEYTLLKATSFTRTDSIEFSKTPKLSTFGTLGEISTHQFKPPKFGITVLGNSHGFDPKGSTSGYIIWVDGR